MPWEDMCRGETCAGRNMCHGKPWEHMCLGKTGATGRHMPGENMCRWITCATGKYAMVKRVPGEACATVNRGNICASGKQVPGENICRGNTCAMICTMRQTNHESKASLKRYTLDNTLEQRTKHFFLSPGIAFIEAFITAFICLFVPSPIRLKRLSRTIKVCWYRFR